MKTQSPHVIHCFPEGDVEGPEEQENNDHFNRPFTCCQVSAEMEMERFKDRSGLWEELGVVWSVGKGLF